MGKGGTFMPLTELQKRVLEVIAENRSVASHLAGASGILMSSASPRRSADLDLFHDHEVAVANAFQADRATLERHGYSLQLQLSQPGFIRALISTEQHEQIRMDWAYDSAWRFMPPVKIKGAGFVLHPVDLAINKVLALIGRDEPREFIDVVYLHQRVLPLGSLAWAASGKDAGLNPNMVLELLGRRRIRGDDLSRLDLVKPLDAMEQESIYRDALDQGKNWVEQRPPHEAGCLYRKTNSGLFFAPSGDESYEIHRGCVGGVLPKTTPADTWLAGEQERKNLESFFEHPLHDPA